MVEIYKSISRTVLSLKRMKAYTASNRVFWNHSIFAPLWMDKVELAVKMGLIVLGLIFALGIILATLLI